MSPSAHTSALGVMAPSRSTCSGAIHPGVPMPPPIPEGALAKRAMPKSRTFTM